jgi:hypothetical protein
MVDLEGIEVFKRGKYLQAIFNGSIKVASFSFISFRKWGDTKYFDLLDKHANEHLMRNIESKHIRMYHSKLFGKDANISSTITDLKRVGDYIYAKGSVSLTVDGKTKIIKIEEYLYNNEGELKDVDKKEIIDIKKFFD